MTAQHPHQLCAGHPHEIAPLDIAPPEIGPMAATIADDTSVLITVSRFVEPLSADAAGAALTVVAVDGEIDIDTTPLLRSLLMQALRGSNPVCCDLGGVTFFGAAGANTLLAVHRHATESGRDFSVRGVYGITGLVLSVADPDRVIAWQR